MATSVDEAFNVLIARLTPTGAETTTAALHRASIEACLQNSLGLISLFRSGSFGHGTSVSGFSDVDYFAVVPPARLNQNSNISLEQFRIVLQRRFPSTARIRVQSPAVIVPFGSSDPEQHEIIPAHRVADVNGYRRFGIPNRAGGWMFASPDAHGFYVDRHHIRLGEKLKPLIRLLKAWKFYSNVSIPSFYLEMRVCEFASHESSILYKLDVRSALEWLARANLNDMPDPMGISEPFSAGGYMEKALAQQAISAAINSANYAVTAESMGRIADAFSYWDQVFNGNFPGYY